ncbi:uS2 family ribosomal protein [Listeria cossartiae]|nr:uS2 family ribosomal protein [Listeria cossartiae]MCD2225583.1 uS2 family ribosomal protein [Listeria cossartiae]MCD2240334.1 uS2 family ribosomal protein [Listeria cossartiae]
MPVISMKQLLEAGVHFGLAKRFSPLNYWYYAIYATNS